MVVQAHCFWLLALLFMGIWSTETVQCDQHLVLIGGNLRDDHGAIYDKIVELCGGKGYARIGVITAASEDAQDNGQFYVSQFEKFGAKEAYWVPIQESDPETAFDPIVAQKVSEMTGFFFGGGDQRRLISLLFTKEEKRQDSPVLAEIRAMFSSGSAAIAGTSAGCVGLTGSVMVTGGYSYESLRDGSSLNSTFEANLSYDPQGGLGFFPGFLLDTHFGQRGREGRLIRLIADTKHLDVVGTSYGIGIDEDTALVVSIESTGRIKGEVIGSNGIFLPNLKNALTSTDSNGHWAARDVFSHYLRPGDELSLTDWTVEKVPQWKEDLQGNQYHDEASTSDDIFKGANSLEEQPEFAFISTRLLDSRSSETYGNSYETKPQFRIVMGKNQVKTRGYGGYDPASGDFDISYQDLEMEIQPCHHHC